MDNTKPPCIFPDCSKQSKIRGLCQTHYTSLRHLVLEGKTTFENLEKNGKILPRKFRINTGFQSWALEKTGVDSSDREVAP